MLHSLLGRMMCCDTSKHVNDIYLEFKSCPTFLIKLDKRPLKADANFVNKTKCFKKTAAIHVEEREKTQITENYTHHHIVKRSMTEAPKATTGTIIF